MNKLYAPLSDPEEAKGAFAPPPIAVFPYV